ncbi:MAG: hypothetical protein FD153_939 [Rhodospirillaceae bacterium]|nr:MAG: hypothetical protein FD153_939 [Rhodospirillaceae bacterium]
MSQPDPDELLYKIIRIGKTCKVTALDPVTGLEASLVAPAHFATSVLLMKQAKRKPRLLIKKKELPQSSRLLRRPGLYT